MKKLFSKIVALILVLSMLLSVTACAGEPDSFDVVAKLSVKEGFTTQITPTNLVNVTTFSYLSNEAEIASVSDTGLVTGVNVGTTTITVAGGEATRTIEVTVEKNEINNLSVKKLNNIVSLGNGADIVPESGNGEAFNFGWGTTVTEAALAEKVDFASNKEDSVKTLRCYSDVDKYSAVINGSFAVVMSGGTNTAMTDATTPTGVHSSVYAKVQVSRLANSLRVWGASWKDETVSGKGEFRVMAYTKAADGLSYDSVVLKGLDIGALTQAEDGYIRYVDTVGAQITDAPGDNMFVFSVNDGTYDLRNKEVVLSVEFRAFANTDGVEGANKQSRFGIKRIGFILDPEPDFTVSTEKDLILEVGATSQIATSIVGSLNPDEFVYTSNKLDIATVSTTGLITAVGAGDAIIKIENGGVSREVNVKVANGKFTIEANKELSVGNIYVITPTNVEGIQSFTYSSSNDAVATVGADGKVTAVKAGTAIISVKGGDLVKKLTVSVVDAVLYGNNISTYKDLVAFTAAEADIEGATGATGLNFVPSWGGTATLSADNSAANTVKTIRGYIGANAVLQREENWTNLICSVGGLPAGNTAPHAAIFTKLTVPDKANFRVWTFGGAKDAVVSARGMFRVVFYVPNADYTSYKTVALEFNYQESTGFVVAKGAEGWVTYEASLDGFFAYPVPAELKGKEVIVAVEAMGRSADLQDRFMVKRMGFCN